MNKLIFRWSKGSWTHQKGTVKAFIMEELWWFKWIFLVWL